MKVTILIALMMAVFVGCSSSGTGACPAAGGQCMPGGAVCANRGPQNCNPDQNPGGSFCCLPCPTGTKANDAGTTCE